MVDVQSSFCMLRKQFLKASDSRQVFTPCKLTVCPITGAVHYNNECCSAGSYNRIPCIVVGHFVNTCHSYSQI